MKEKITISLSFLDIFDKWGSKFVDKYLQIVKDKMEKLCPEYEIAVKLNYYQVKFFVMFDEQGFKLYDPRLSSKLSSVVKEVEKEYGNL